MPTFHGIITDDVKKNDIWSLTEDEKDNGLSQNEKILIAIKPELHLRKSFALCLVKYEIIRSLWASGTRTVYNCRDAVIAMVYNKSTPLS